MQLFHPRRHKQLRASQTYVEYIKDDRRIYLFRALYHIIADAYDERQEIDKDVWDLRKLGLKRNPTQSQNLLNFTAITQPWLLQLAKEFMRYEIAVRSDGTSISKLTAIRRFSRFLAEQLPDVRARDIDRTLLVHYITLLRAQPLSAGVQNNYLVDLRIFLETCAHHLHAPSLTKERLIFDEDLTKIP